MTILSGAGTRLQAVVNNASATPLTAAYTHPPLIPNDVRVRGVNISPLYAWTDTPDQGSVWSAMWRVWDWNGTLKPQIDDAATIANTVRVFGNTHAVTSGNITLTTYLARWKQLLDYCVTQSLYVYPCGGSLAHWGVDTTYTAATGLFTAWADLLATYSNVISVDITNEAWGDIQQTGYPDTMYDEPEPYLVLLHHLGRVVRAHAGVPVTHSMGIWSSDAWPVMDADLERLFSMSDYIDLHIYADGATPELVAAYLVRPVLQGKQMLIGEFGGLDTSVSSATRTARYEAVHDIVVADADYCGAMAWCCWDANEVNSRWGLFDADRALRSDIGTPFATLPVTRRITFPGTDFYPSDSLYPGT